MAEEKKKDEKPKDEARVVEVPTQMGLMVELPDGRVVNDLEFRVELYNMVYKVKKALG